MVIRILKKLNRRTICTSSKIKINFRQEQMGKAENCIVWKTLKGVSKIQLKDIRLWITNQSNQKAKENNHKQSQSQIYNKKTEYKEITFSLNKWEKSICYLK